MKRCLKRLGFTFRRARRVPPKAPHEQQDRVKRALTRLHRLNDAGKCHVLYGDESGLCLHPPLPYLWQPKGETLGLPAKSHSIEILWRQMKYHWLGCEAYTDFKTLCQSVEDLLQRIGTQYRISFAWLLSMKRPQILSNR